MGKNLKGKESETLSQILEYINTQALKQLWTDTSMLRTSHW